MSDFWRWQCRGPGCRACFESEGVIGGATCPYCGNTGRRIMLLDDDRVPNGDAYEERQLRERNE